MRSVPKLVLRRAHGSGPLRGDERGWGYPLPSTLVGHRPSCSRLPSGNPPLCVRDRCACKHLRASGGRRSTPGALAPVRVMLSRSILAYLAPSAPLAGTSRLHRLAAYTGCLRCAYGHRPRRPTTGSELSLMVFRNLSPSETAGNFPVALTQYF